MYAVNCRQRGVLLGGRNTLAVPGSGMSAQKLPHRVCNESWNWLVPHTIFLS